jgi:Zn-dependent protease
MSLSPGFILAILLALSVHEWAHGYVASRLGDDTARMMGRLTLNPLAHLDLIGTVMFLIVGFGWGKPVPVDASSFRHPRRDMALVAAAGPLSNLTLAFTAVFVWMALPALTVLPVPFFLLLEDFLQNSLFVNLGLMAFNLLPVAPLDGSKILGLFIPYRYEAQYQDFMQRGPMILLFLLIGERILGTPLIVGWIMFIINPVLSVMEKLM